jgi:hypothetical protein
MKDGFWCSRQDSNTIPRWDPRPTYGKQSLNIKPPSNKKDGFWCSRGDSNPRPIAPQASALIH